MNTVLWNDAYDGTTINHMGRENEVRMRVAVPFGVHTWHLDADEVDHLLAVVEASSTPIMDISEYFQAVHNVQRTPADRAARAFVACAGSLAETVR